VPLPARSSRAFERGIDALVYALAAVVAVRVTTDGGSRPALAATLTLAVAAVYTAGTFPIRRHSRAAAVWFAVLVAAWVALVVVDITGVYLAFALFFVALDRFRPRVAVLLVTAMTAAVALAEILQQPSLGAPAVIGPVIGAAVAVAMGLGYRSLEHENEQRRALLEELHQTQSELALAEHTRGVLEERERLAREIHDTVAQGLASIVILLGATGEELRGDNTDAALDHVDQARATARANLDEARRFVRALAPVALDGATLEDALERLCADTSVPGHLKVRYATTGTRYPLSPDTEVAVLRVAQSALANVTAHSGARHGRVTLTYMPDGITLDIHDDGHGFDPDTVEQRRGPDSGFGLVTMQQRVEALGGTLTIESAPGEGAVIAAAIPTSAPAPTPGTNAATAILTPDPVAP